PRGLRGAALRVAAGDDRAEAFRPVHVKGRSHMVEEPRVVDDHVRGKPPSLQGVVEPGLSMGWTDRIRVENHPAEHVRIMSAPLRKPVFISLIRPRNGTG